MSQVYDNWERLMAAVLKRQQYRELALAESRETSFSSSSSERFASRFNFKFPSANLYPKEYYTERIWAVDQLIKTADAATSFKKECRQLKSKARELGSLLRQAERASGTLYDRPARRIMDDTEQVLQKAINLISKCRGVRHMFATISPTAFSSLLSQLEHSIRNLSWLLSDGRDDDDYNNLSVLRPPIAADEPTLCYVWELIAILQTGSVEDKCDAVASLVSLGREDDLYCKLIMEEGGFPPLLRLLKEGTPEVQEKTATAIGLLSSLLQPGKYIGMLDIIDARVGEIFATTFDRGPRKVQAAVAWAVSQLAENDSRWQDHFMEHYMIELLVKHLVVKREPLNQSKLAVSLVDSVLNHHLPLAGETEREREAADAIDLISKSTRALHHLAKGNPKTCIRIVDLKAFPRFVGLLEQGRPKVAQYNCLMTLMEITAVAEREMLFRKSTFMRSAAILSTITHELFRLIDEADTELLVPCIKTIGNLARTFRATETGMISPLVRLLDNDEASEVFEEACAALVKFASPYNYLHMKYSSIIVDSGGIKHLVQAVYFKEKTAQTFSLVLLCYLAKDLPNRDEFGEYDVLAVLKWAQLQPSLMLQYFASDDEISMPEAIARLEIHRSRISTTSHSLSSLLWQQACSDQLKHVACRCQPDPTFHTISSSQSITFLSSSSTVDHPSYLVQNQDRKTLGCLAGGGFCHFSIFL